MQIGKKTLLLFIMLVELSSSCSAKIPTKSVPSFSNSPFSTTQLGIPSPTITNLPTAQINFSCWLIKPLEEGNEIKGSFFYIHEPVPQNSLDENDYFIWDISSFHSKEHALNKRFRDIMISFSGDKVTALGDDLFFISNHGVQSYLLPDESFAKDKFYYIKYEQPKRDGKIFIREYGQIDNYTEGSGFTDTFYIFDPQSRKTSERQLFLPNLYKLANRNPFAEYSPSMKYTLYESTPDDGNHRQYTLYDIENEKVLMVIPPQNSNLEIIDDNPQWLSNADIVTAEFYDRKTEKHNQYFISLDGAISPITNLPDGISISTGFLGSQYWSPNNRYFALSDFNLHLYLWDNQTDTLYKPCLPNENNVMSAPQLTWSFDGNYVVVTLVFPSLATPIVDPSGQIIEQRTVSKYILDFSNKTMYSLPNDVNEKEYPQNFTNGHYQYIGWVNWEIP